MDTRKPKGPRGHGDCKSPVSSIESCTEDSRLLLNYQACPDVYGSESTGHSFVSLYFDPHSALVVLGRCRRKTSLMQIVSQVNATTFELVKPVITVRRTGTCPEEVRTSGTSRAPSREASTIVLDLAALGIARPGVTVVLFANGLEELECLATWKEGSLRFLVGKLHHNHATSNEDRYRCFVYERTNNGMASGGVVKESGDGVEYRVAQSGDATCNGLFSATEGSRTMALKRVSVRFNCQFPPWMTISNTWHTLDFSSNYTFHAKNATLRITNQTGADIKVYCVNIKASSPTGNSIALVAHWQHHCASRYVCMVLYRRDTHIAELQRGALTARPDDACSSHHFNAVTAPYITLVVTKEAAENQPSTSTRRLLKSLEPSKDTIRRHTQSLDGPTVTAEIRSQLKFLETDT
ncbi:hypothetical protein EVAR_85357_1 [Eumeta japonica]|uniref:Uncharacterized protein n=1 Tax=Eumeta variegata TaxID=151549 RepID=A0A4C1WVH0_EUMVA|nr:hypothetical protein EVAR_85357_1 [Eumeta japonica]